MGPLPDLPDGSSVLDHALRGCQFVEHSAVEGHRLEVKELDPRWSMGAALAVCHTCPGGSRNRIITLQLRDEQRFKVGGLEVATRVFAGFCPKCDALLAGAVEVDRRPHRGG